MPSVVVTILFTDLVGSTELLGALGEDAAESLRREMFRLLRQATAAHDGEEVKTIGDSLMVAFVSPAEAVGCAVDMQRALDAHNISGRQPLAVRIGINAGEAAREDGDYFGTPVVVAKRLCDAAEGAQILASDLVRALVGSRGGFTFKELGALPLKGIDDPVPACEIAWEPAGGALPLPAVIAARDPTPFVGRAPQRDALDHTFARARDGRRTLAMVAGEPGIGKTRLAFEFARAAHAGGAIVLYGHCDEEALLPYQPFVEALRFLIANGDPEELSGQLGPTGGDLARLVPELAARVPSVPEPISADPETERFRLFDAVGHLLTEVGRTAPVVLVLDDLHWSDAPTLTLLKHVLRWPVDSRLLIVGTYRDVELDRRHPLADVLADLRRDDRFERVVLHGLTRDEVEAMLRERARHDLSAEAQRLVDALHAETEGNPFFIREIIRHLVESGAIYQDDQGRWTSNLTIEHVGLPEGVREVIGRRLARLSDDCNDALRIASVIGRSFDLRVLEQASNSESSALLDVLQQGVDARVLAEEPGAIDRFTFTHALIRETLSSELTTSRRVRLHARVGEILETLAPDDPPYAELAYHFHEAAAITGNDEKCVDYSRRAGESAREMSAYEEAAGHFRRALEMLQEMRDVAPARRFDLTLALGEALRAAGDPGAKAVMRQAEEQARAARDSVRRARAVLAYGALWSEIGLVDHELIELLRSCIQDLPEDEIDLRARLHARIAIEHGMGLEPVAGAADAERAAEIAELLDDASTHAYVLLARRHVVLGPANLDDRLRTSRAAEHAAEEAGELEMAQRARGFRALDQCESADRDGLAENVDRFADAAQVMRRPFYLYVAELLLTERAIREGSMDEADARLAEVYRLMPADRVTSWLAWSAAAAFIRWYQGRTEEVLPKIKEIWGPLAEFAPPLGSYYAETLYRSGESEAAETLYRSTLGPVLALEPTHWLFLNGSVSFLANRLGDRDTLDTLRRRWEPYAGYVICNGPTSLVANQGPVAGALAVACAHLGRTGEAEHYLIRAHEINDRLRSPLLRAHTDLEMAWGLVGAGHSAGRARAAELADQAAAFAEAHRGVGMIEDIRALRARL